MLGPISHYKQTARVCPTSVAPPNLRLSVSQKSRCRSAQPPDSQASHPCVCPAVSVCVCSGNPKYWHRSRTSHSNRFEQVLYVSCLHTLCQIHADTCTVTKQPIWLGMKATSSTHNRVCKGKRGTAWGTTPPETTHPSTCVWPHGKEMAAQRMHPATGGEGHAPNRPGGRVACGLAAGQAPVAQPQTRHLISETRYEYNGKINI